LAGLDTHAAWQPDSERALARLRARANRATGRSQRWLWTGVFVAATSAAVLAFPPAHALAERCLAACVGQSSRLGDYLWKHPASHAGEPIAASVRAMAPELSLPDRSGRTIRLADYRGQVVLVNFWATWCAPCRREIPWLMALEQTYGSRGLRVVGVSLDEDGWPAVETFVADHAIGYPIVLGNDEVSARFGGINALPTTLLIDREGRIAVTHTGLIDQSEIDAQVAQLIGG
jgi:peroxiredoxin